MTDTRLILIPTHFCEALDDAAFALRVALDTRAYTAGAEDSLADEAIASLHVTERADALEGLVNEQAMHFVLSDCHLSETEDATYALAGRIAYHVLDAIRAEQQPLLDTLQTWTSRAICERADLLRIA